MLSNQRNPTYSVGGTDEFALALVRKAAPQLFGFSWTLWIPKQASHELNVQTVDDRGVREATHLIHKVLDG